MNIMLTCDFCGQFIEFGDSIYIDDVNCIMICEECYNNLPDDEPDVCGLCLDK